MFVQAVKVLVAAKVDLNQVPSSPYIVMALYSYGRT